ncbi:MAG: hypothetical protein U0V04_11260 [Spirosomataceae bacterium]
MILDHTVCNGECINRQQMLTNVYMFENKVIKQKISISINNDIDAIGVHNWIYTNVGGN